MAVVIAIGVREKGEQEILGVDIGAAEAPAFWTTFLRGLVCRGLKKVNLVISDARQGLREAVSAVLTGTAWQRWRVHFMRSGCRHVGHSCGRQVDS